MKFLAIDTSGKHLTVAVYNGDSFTTVFLPECATKHSVLLMQKIDEAFIKSGMTPNDCDFFAVVVGPGSFTGIRIGIATVKGLCFACAKPAVAVTSFDCIAYAEKKKTLALVDAGHGAYYACGYDENQKITVEAKYRSGEEVQELIASGFPPAGQEELFAECEVADICQGLQNAVLAKCGELVGAEELNALYLRKSSAEEHRS